MDMSLFKNKDHAVLVEYLVAKHSELVKKAGDVLNESKNLIVDGAVNDELNFMRLIGRGNAINEEANVVLKELSDLTGWEPPIQNI